MTNHFYFSDNAANFLRTWFSRIRRKVDNILNNDQQSERARLRRSVSKKEIRPPPSFEILERAYLLTLSKKHLEQLFGYVKFINQDNETRTQIDQLMEEQVARLQKMTLEQLKVYCAKLQTAMKNGISLNHEITVNGRRYSLESIAQVCCPWG